MNTSNEKIIPEFCDMCGRDLDEFELDYIIKIEAYAGDFRKDLAIYCEANMEEEIQRLIKRAQKKSEPELMDEVYRKMIFKVCPSCHKEYLRNPISRNFNRGRGKR